ncbi:MAG: AtpZ/AtpI family protein [Patescibacteria group bacterium]
MKYDSNKSAVWQALGIAWELGYTITVPLVVLAILGRFLDNHFGTSPWLLLSGIILSIFLSSLALVWKFTKIMAAVNKDINKDKQDKEINK